MTLSKPPSPYEQLLPLPTPCFKMFLENPLMTPTTPPQAFFTATPSSSTTPAPPPPPSITIFIIHLFMNSETKS